ncbi:ABC transporter substrate-binding protein [Marinobacter bohaiensis]|uniref:ABC transporter substrate-binding protein n=1 Tax=Marinobacter bohaiensis TaxID=2201898 RepID=UPI000DAC9460|nr:ABC transporter substrate-binding protein [Marinobacter bohaiensis]
MPRVPDRIDLVRWALALALGCWTSLAAALDVTDLAGRQVTVPDRIERIVLGESRYIPALAILEGERVMSRIVGMLPDFELTDPAAYQQYRRRFPALAEIPVIGHASADSFSLESVIGLQADVAIFSLEGHGPGAHNRQLIERLEAAGVAVVFVDFRQQPLRNTPRSMTLLGELLGREARAAEYNRFWREALAAVTGPLAEVPASARPRVFLHSRVGLLDNCCETMADGMIGHLLEAAGGRNVAAGVVPGVAGILNPEYLLTHQPDVYLATAIGTPDRRTRSGAAFPYVTLGTGVSEAVARQSLGAATRQPAIAELTAVREGRAYAVWHHFYNTPLNVVAVQAMARWFHPRRFAGLDPHATLARLYERFQPVALDGTFWIALDGTP